jgi:hypothetical protein
MHQHLSFHLTPKKQDATCVNLQKTCFEDANPCSKIAFGFSILRILPRIYKILPG